MDIEIVALNKDWLCKCSSKVISEVIFKKSEHFVEAPVRLHQGAPLVCKLH